jgi:hypothetical protein
MSEVPSTYICRWYLYLGRSFFKGKLIRHYPAHICTLIVAMRCTIVISIPSTSWIMYFSNNPLNQTVAWTITWVDEFIGVHTSCFIFKAGNSLDNT